MTNPVMILTDSSAYLPADLVSRYPIGVIPLILNWDGVSYRDGVDMQANEFYQRLSTSNTIPTTSQFTAGELRQYIHPLLEEGYDVLVLPISSGLSSAYQTAVKEVQNYPKGRVAVVDTKLVSMPLAFQVLAAARSRSRSKFSGMPASCASGLWKHWRILYRGYAQVPGRRRAH